MLKKPIKTHKKSERKEIGRKPRLDMAGFHHVVNRGIERSINAIEDDYKQVELAIYLGISESAVSKIFYGF